MPRHHCPAWHPPHAPLLAATPASAPSSSPHPRARSAARRPAVFDLAERARRHIDRGVERLAAVGTCNDTNSVGRSHPPPPLQHGLEPYSASRDCGSRGSRVFLVTRAIYTTRTRPRRGFGCPRDSQTRRRPCVSCALSTPNHPRRCHRQREAALGCRLPELLAMTA